MSAAKYWGCCTMGAMATCVVVALVGALTVDYPTIQSWCKGLFCMFAYAALASAFFSVCAPD